MQDKLSISMDPELVKRLRRIARDEDSNLSAVIERLCFLGVGDAEAVAAARRDPLTERIVAEMLRPENIERAARIVGETAAEPGLFRRRAEALVEKVQRRGKR